jgi:hypothetical protein
MDAATDAARRMTNLASRTPVEIDTTLAALDTEYHGLTRRLRMILGTVHVAAGDKQRRIGRREQWSMTDADAVAALRDKIETGTVNLSYADMAPTTMANYDETDRQANANRYQFERLNAEHGRRRWTRFVIVEHVHSGDNCVGGTLDRGLYRSERHWLPEYSGRSEAEAIAELADLAHTLCTHCFPGAPVVKAAVDPTSCAGQTYDRTRLVRRGRASGNGAFCTECGGWATFTSAGNLRKHKRPTTSHIDGGA